MQFNNIRLVQFDLDGTLIDIKEILDRCDIQTIEEFTGKKLTLEEFRKLSDPGADQLDHYKKFGILDPIEGRKAWLRYSYLEEISSGYAVHDGVFEVLDFLISKDIKIHLTTRHEGMQAVDNKMRNTGLGKYFTHENITITGVDKYKDILNVCKKYNIQPNETVFVSDTKFDMEQGKKAGVFTIAKAGPASFNTDDKLKLAHPDKLIHSIKEIKEIIK